MNESDERAGVDGSAVELDLIPVPVARYAARGDGVVIFEANDRFADSFTATDPGIPVRKWWSANDLSARRSTVDDLCAALRAGESVDATVTAGGSDRVTYRLRAVSNGGSPTVGTFTMTGGAEASRGAVAEEQIASVISHDLRNPLDVAKAHLSAARETGDPEHFDSLERAHDRMERIIGDVLTLSRGDQVVDPSRRVELDAVATDAWNTVDTGRASVAISEDLPTVEADPDRLQRLFENLFRNSIEHGTGEESSPPERAEEDETGASGTEGAEVTIRVGATDDGFFVADDGDGVAQDRREQVFEPGYSDADRGTGLGLTIVEQIALAHDWDLALVESTDGGARFEFGIPDSGAG